MKRVLLWGCFNWELVARMSKFPVDLAFPLIQSPPISAILYFITSGAYTASPQPNACWQKQHCKAPTLHGPKYTKPPPWWDDPLEWRALHTCTGQPSTYSSFLRESTSPEPQEMLSLAETLKLPLGPCSAVSGRPSHDLPKVAAQVFGGPSSFLDRHLLFHC